MSTKKEKPSYEELVKEVQQLRTYKQISQKAILRYLQKCMTPTYELISGTELPIKMEKFYGFPDFIDMEHPDADMLIGSFAKTIQID